MPTSHRRIGLIVDEPLDRALDLFRGPDETIPEAAVARRAVIEGALLASIVQLAAGNGVVQDRAAHLIAQVRELLPALALDKQLLALALEQLGRVEDRPAAAERRRRQFALLEEPPAPGAQSAQDLADTLDAFERLPAR